MHTQPKHTMHILHAFLALMSGGLWLPIWVWRSISNGRYNSRAGFSSDQSKSSSLFNLLRIIRCFCGLIVVLQLIQLFPVLTWVTQPQAVTGNMMAILTIKVAAMIVFCGLFFGLRWLINHLHVRRYGVPHPTLALRKWAL